MNIYVFIGRGLCRETKLNAPVKWNVMTPIEKLFIPRVSKSVQHATEAKLPGITKIESANEARSCSNAVKTSKRIHAPERGG